MTRIDANNVKSSIGNHMLADGMDPIIDLEKSHGSWIVDARNSREYLDLFSMFASLSIGYNHPYVLKNKERLTVAAINKPTNSDVYSTQMAEFVESMGTKAQPEYLPYSFFIEGGTLAVENALKASFDWKTRKNQSHGKSTEASKIIHFKECFHGRSGYTLSLTDSQDKRKTDFFPKFEWPRITNPKLRFPLNGANLAAVSALEDQAVDEIKKAISGYVDEIAAIIIEPIQGEGGDNHFRVEFFIKLREIANENDIILIYDEVQTGIGITGKMWAHQHFGENARPDIISFGKKTQVCGIFAGNRFDEIEDSVFHQPSRLNSTWGGNLTDMVRFNLYLDVIENDQLVQNAADRGKSLLEGLIILQNKHGEIISNSRGRGLFCAFDLPTSKDQNKLLGLIREEGALMLGCGERTIRFRPHLNLSLDDLNTGLGIIDRAISRM
ncbi:MAG: L-lysine 6-transaminase [Candidatus Neomarinimicrobiota bacterium]